MKLKDLLAVTLDAVKVELHSQDLNTFELAYKLRSLKKYEHLLDKQVRTIHAQENAELVVYLQWN